VLVRQHLEQMKRDAEQCGVTVTAAPPSRVTVGRFVASLPATVKEARHKHVRDVLDARRPHDRYSRSDRPNVVWEIDHSQVDAWMLFPEADGTRTPVRPYLMTCVDEATQFCLSYFITRDAPTGFAMSCLLFHAFTPWQLIGRHDTCRPQVIRTDNGSIYVGEHAERVLQQNGIEHARMPPADPTKNAEVERLFGTLKGQMQELPGYCGQKVAEDRRIDEPDTERMITFEQFHVWLERTLHRHNTTIDPNHLLMTRAERWRQSLGAPVLEDFPWRLLRSDVIRTFNRGEVEFQGITYRIAERRPGAPPLHDLHGRQVRVCFTPTRRDLIWVTTYDPANPENELLIGRMERPTPGQPTTPFTDEVYSAEQWARHSVCSLKGLAAATERAKHDAALQQRLDAEMVASGELFAISVPPGEKAEGLDGIDPELLAALEPPDDEVTSRQGDGSEARP
jgi:transposase InsO family protein